MHRVCRVGDVHPRGGRAPPFEGTPQRAIPSKASDCNDCDSNQPTERTMTTQQLVCIYLQLRGELASAYAAEVWKSCRLGHIERVSRELATVEQYRAPHVMLLYPHHQELGDSPGLRDSYLLEPSGIGAELRTISVGTLDLRNLGTVPAQLEEMLKPLHSPCSP